MSQNKNDQPHDVKPETAESKVRRALEAYPGTTAANLASMAGVGRSTATKILAVGPGRPDRRQGPVSPRHLDDARRSVHGSPEDWWRRDCGPRRRRARTQSVADAGRTEEGPASEGRTVRPGEDLPVRASRRVVRSRQDRHRPGPVERRREQRPGTARHQRPGHENMRGTEALRVQLTHGPRTARSGSGRRDGDRTRFCAPKPSGGMSTAVARSRYPVPDAIR